MGQCEVCLGTKASSIIDILVNYGAIVLMDFTWAKCQIKIYKGGEDAITRTTGSKECCYCWCIK